MQITYKDKTYESQCVNGASPQHYDIHLDGKKVGYAWFGKCQKGYFIIGTFDTGWGDPNDIYTEQIEGTTGFFTTNAQRDKYLTLAVEKIHKYLELRRYDMNITYRGTTYSLDCLCDAGPEQYDVYIVGDKVGYIKLKNGRFTVKIVAHQGNILWLLYRKRIEGSDGCFDSQEQRDKYLYKAVKKIHKFLKGDE